MSIFVCVCLCLEACLEGRVLAHSVYGEDGEALGMFSSEKLGCPAAHASRIWAFHKVAWGEVVDCGLDGAPWLVCSWGLKGFFRAGMDGFVVGPDGMDRLVDG